MLSDPHCVCWREVGENLSSRAQGRLQSKLQPTAKEKEKDLVARVDADLREEGLEIAGCSQQHRLHPKCCCF
jgi:hypothetical protein